MFQILHILSRCFDTLSFFFASYKLKGRSLLSWPYLKIRDGFSAIGLPSSGHDRINSPMRASIVVPMLNKFFFFGDAPTRTLDVCLVAWGHKRDSDARGTKEKA
jgi:hypothetical protein